MVKLTIPKRKVILECACGKIGAFEIQRIGVNRTKCPKCGLWLYVKIETWASEECDFCHVLTNQHLHQPFCPHKGEETP